MSDLAHHGTGRHRAEYSLLVLLARTVMQETARPSDAMFVFGIVFVVVALAVTVALRSGRF